MKKIILSVLIGSWHLSPLVSQNPDSINPAKKLENYIRFNYDNDFFSATDRYYTQGIHLTIIHPVIKYSPFSHALIRLGKNALNYYGLQFNQDCYTPRSIRYDSINYKERPYAATFFVSHVLTSLDPLKKVSLQTQLDLGVIGPCAKCEEEQKGIHKALKNIQPLGWENQVKTDYIVNYMVKVEKGLLMLPNLELMGNSVLRLGTLYSDLGAGLIMRLGFLKPYFNNLGLEKNSPHQKFQLYGLFKLNGRGIGYNAALQGGFFNKSSMLTVPDDKISRFVVDGLAGVVMAYKRVSLEYSKTVISPEFNGGLSHGWGKCVISVCF